MLLDYSFRSVEPLANAIDFFQLFLTGFQKDFWPVTPLLK